LATPSSYSLSLREIRSPTGSEAADCDCDELGSEEAGSAGASF